MKKDLESLTDPELNEVVAVEVAGWVREKRARYAGHTKVHGFGRNLHLPLGSAGRDFIPGPGLLPPYSTSADAVLRLLVQAGRFEVSYLDQPPRFRVCFMSGQGEAATFPRAACVAIIRNARASKGSK